MLRIIAAKSFCFHSIVQFPPIFALGGTQCWLDLEYILIVISRKFEMMIQKVLFSDNKPV